MAKVFVSYSRKDIEFAKKLTGELQKSDLDFWIDWEGIPPTVDWWREIEKGIEEADVFVFLISPDSAKSKICGQEIDTAVKNGKRIIPIVVREIDWEDTPPQLGHLNYIFFSRDDDFDTGVKKLMIAIQTDYEWAATHRRLQVKALEWERNNHENSFLLRGKDLQDAELQLGTNSSKEPRPTDLQRDYVLKSRQAADRLRRITTGISIAGIIALAALAVFGFVQAGQATKNASTAQANLVVANTAQANAESAQSTAVANEAEAIEQAALANAGKLAALSSSLQKNNFQTSILLGLEAYSRVPNAQSESVLLGNAQANPDLRAFLSGHTSAVTAVVFSPDSKMIASASWDKTIILWDAATGKPVGAPLTGHSEAVSSLAFSPDGKTLASASWDKTIILWDVATGKAIGEPLTGHTDKVLSVAFSPNGKVLASGSEDNTVILWNAKTGKPVFAPFNESDLPVSAVAFSPNGLTMATGSGTNIYFWDVEKGKYRGAVGGNAEVVNCLVYSPDGKLLAAGGGKTGVADNVFLFDVVQGVQIAQLYGHDGYINSVSFSPDSKFLASGSYDSTIIIWDIVKRQHIGEALIAAGRLYGHGSNVSSVAFSPDGKTIVSGSNDSSIILWNFPIGEYAISASNLSIQNKLYGAHTGAVRSLAFSPNGQKMASGSYDNTIVLWDSITYQSIGETLNLPVFCGGDCFLPGDLTFQLRGINSLTFSPDSKILASGSSDTTITLWDAGTGQAIGEPLTGHTDIVSSVAFSPDGKTLASGSYDGSIIFWDVAARKPIGEPLTGHTQAVTSVAFSPDGKTIASAAMDDTIILWDVASRQPIGEPLTGHIQSVSSVVFSPDGTTLASGSSDSTIILWDVETGNMIGQPLTGHIGGILSLAYSADGKFLASSSADSTIMLWETATGESLGQIQLLESGLTGRNTPREGVNVISNSVAFNPDGNILASSGNSDYSIVLWDMNPQSWIEKSCQRVGRNLTRAEWAKYIPGEDYPAKQEDAICPQWPLEP